MPNLPTLHQYSDRTAFERLLLLVATIARHPGIGPSPEAILEAMQRVATDQGRECPDWSTATITKDLQALKYYDLLPRTRCQHGYTLVGGEPVPKPPPKPPSTRSEMPVKKMRALKKAGLTYPEIGRLAGLSRQRVQQLLED